jgi:hypothetical protein
MSDGGGIERLLADPRSIGIIADGSPSIVDYTVRCMGLAPEDETRLFRAIADYQSANPKYPLDAVQLYVTSFWKRAHEPVIEQSAPAKQRLYVNSVLSPNQLFSIAQLRPATFNIVDSFGRPWYVEAVAPKNLYMVITRVRPVLSSHIDVMGE